MKIVLAHSTGNQFVRALAEALLKAGMLAEFHTTLAIDPADWWLRMLPRRHQQALLRRTFPVPARQTHTHPLREMARLLLPQLGLPRPVRPEAGWASIDTVYQQLDRVVSRRLGRLRRRAAATAVYAYEDGALATFTQAKTQGMRCVYDLPIAYWETTRRLLAQEAERLPRWAATLGGGIHDSAAKLERKTQELALADMVVSPSQFVLDSLPAWAATKQVVTVPFGTPPGPAPPPGQQHPQRPLRVLFAGSLGQRKGLGDLFAAVQLLPPGAVELVALGPLLAPLAFYRQQLPQLTYEPSRPHDQVLALMRTCDVCCLPSIVEGRALVMQEAMSQGLPLLITPNTGGADLILEGETGFLVPIRSPETLASKLTWFLENRTRIPEMGCRAQAHAATYTWQHYGEAILAALAEPAG